MRNGALREYFDGQGGEPAQLPRTFEEADGIVRAGTGADSWREIFERAIRKCGGKHRERAADFLGADSEGGADSGDGPAGNAVFHVRAGSGAFDIARGGTGQWRRDICFRYGRAVEYLRAGEDDDAVCGIEAGAGSGD